MTITSVRNQVLTRLLKSGSFILSLDGEKLKIPKNLQPIKNELIEKSFAALDEANYTTKITTGNDIYWVLNADVSTKDQNVIVSPYTAEAVANIINQYREAMGIATGEADKLQITEEDVQSLIVICSTLLNNVEAKGDTEVEDE